MEKLLVEQKKIFCSLLMTGQSDNLKKDTPMKTKRRTLAAAFAAVLLAIPTTSAIAVNVSSGQGSGYQVATRSWSNGKTVNGSLRSYHGAPVFYSGRVNLRNGGGSTGAMRYTNNITSRSSVKAGGTITGIFGRWTPMSGVQSRVCRHRPYMPDDCGSFSSSY